MKTVRFSFVISLMVIAIVMAFPSGGAAMSGKASGWALDQKVPGYFDDTFTPILVTDRSRIVHAFATQWVGNGGDRRRAIVYRQWTLARGWTRPINILLSPAEGGDAYILGVSLSSDNIFHLIFWASTRTTGYIYYSTALVTDAGSASAWSLPELIGDGGAYPCYGIIDGDDQGNFIVVYNGINDGNGLYMIKSNDGGHTWSESTPLFLTNDPATMAYYIKSYKGASDRLHVVWGLNVIEGAVYDSLYYARIDIKTGTWTTPMLLDKRPNVQGYFGPSVPSIVDNGKYVVIMYNGGNPFTGEFVPHGRPTLLVRLSEDGGDTWGNITNPLPYLTGQSGEQALVVDSNQVVHLMANMRIDKLVDGEYQPIYGIWLSEFKDGIWRDPERFLTTIAPVNIRAVVSQGNVLLATWMEDAGEGSDGVWYSDTTLDAPELPVTPPPTASVPDVAPTMLNTLTVIQSTPLPTNVPALLLDKESAHIVNPQLPILIGILPAVILIGIIVIRTIYVRRK